jgi:hypothetical protein
MAHVYRMFGLTVQSGFPLAGLAELDGDAPGDAERRVRLELTGAGEPERELAGAVERRATLSAGDGETIEVLIGAAHGVLLRYGEHASFHVSATGERVLCAAADASASNWRRVLLDTVLGTAALCWGLEGLHAAAVELPEGVVAIAASTGGGKSTLCAELIRQGARLFADDMVFLSRGPDGIAAHPGPPLMNLPVDAPPLGAPLARFGDELWVSVPDAARDPAPLRAVVLLDRRRSRLGAAIEPMDSTVELLAMALDSGAPAARRRSRFELLGELARSTLLVRLSAGIEEQPGALATLVGDVAAGAVTRA